MSNIALKAENVSKQYRLGTVGTGTLSQDLNRWFAKVRGKEDPFLKIGETNDRTSLGNSEFVWALKDINFEIKQGDVVGIIGRNGAGKSTLLKLLSKTTLPTTGKIKINGRIASLLEVGTGFHPELTGRDNIFLNGAILGMTKKEIQSKFDEIVDFAGVARYVDTPVKRYSSGMYVRLAFAVAAHLDPDILIVDEVLAVGDSEFQKKAIGKMKSVSEEGGRTVLFVSHNMGAVKSLCTSGIYMKNGKVEMTGTIDDVISCYSRRNLQYSSESIFTFKKGMEKGLCIEEVLINGVNSAMIDLSDRSEIEIAIKFNNEIQDRPISIEAAIRDENDVLVAYYSPFHYDGKLIQYPQGEAKIVSNIKLPYNLNKGTYSIELFMTHPNVEYLRSFDCPIIVNVEGFRSLGGNVNPYSEKGYLLLY